MPSIQLAAIITPNPGKSARFLELFNDCVEYVKANEPYVHRYELHRGIPEVNGKEQFVILEGYDDQAALDKHMKAPPVVKLLKAAEEEKLSQTQVIITSPGSGVRPKL